MDIRTELKLNGSFGLVKNPYKSSKAFSLLANKFKTSFASQFLRSSLNYGPKELLVLVKLHLQTEALELFQQDIK